eukprot:COSAG05_NODE_8566_length_692_cov_1.701518_1_plen_69_part_00
MLLNKDMTCSHVPIDFGAENFYEIYSTEVAKKKNGFVLFILTAAAGQNSLDPYSKIFMHVAAADCAVF